MTSGYVWPPQRVAGLRVRHRTEAAVSIPLIEPFVPGDLIGTRYRLEEVVGTGPAATVWRARDEVLERPVAVRLTEGDCDGRRFVEEARTAASVSHGNLVQIYDYGAAAGWRYLIMEYVDGGSLEARLQRGPLSPDEARELACGLLAALNCVHRVGLAHGSVGPRAVLCGSDGRPRLKALGLTRPETAQPSAGGGPSAGGASAGGPSAEGDLHALGIMLGSLPLSGDPDPAFAFTVARLGRPDPGQRPRRAEEALRHLRCAPAAEEPGQATEGFDVLPFDSDLPAVTSFTVTAGSRRRWWPLPPQFASRQVNLP